MRQSKKQVLCPYCGSEDAEVREGNCRCNRCGRQFPPPEKKAAERSFRPMKVFLSYGHTDSEICTRIYEALKARNHDPWFDMDKLHPGYNWREKITQGIAESQSVVSCLSRNSVRDPGVCLNELSIAVGVRGGNIQTILLEPEALTEPPASVCHIQWLDMTQWREKLAAGEAVFQPWFDKKMQQLFAVIESPTSRSFVGQITAIRKKLFVNYDMSTQYDLLCRHYVKRKWLTEAVEKWLRDPRGSRLCLLTGAPGVGKSVFAAHFVHRNPMVAAGLFCRFDRPLYNEPRTVIMTLAYLLACRLPDYRIVLRDVLKDEKRLVSMNVPELFHRLLAEPLRVRKIDGGIETLCIVIDGLDECGDSERNALAEMLGVYAPLLPEWLRVLAVSRDVSPVRGPLEGCFRLELRSDDPRNRENIREYLLEKLSPAFGGDPEFNRALEELTERSGGIFLYARLAAEGIAGGRLSLRDAADLPEGLAGAFFRWFTWFFPDQKEYEERFRLPLERCWQHRSRCRRRSCAVCFAGVRTGATRFSGGFLFCSPRGGTNLGRTPCACPTGISASGWIRPKRSAFAPAGGMRWHGWPGVMPPCSGKSRRR